MCKLLDVLALCHKKIEFEDKVHELDYICFSAGSGFSQLANRNWHGRRGPLPRKETPHFDP